MQISRIRLSADHGIDQRSDGRDSFLGHGPGQEFVDEFVEHVGQVDLRLDVGDLAGAIKEAGITTPSVLGSFRCWPRPQTTA